VRVLRPRPRRCRLLAASHRQAGFGYVGLIFIVAAFGIGLAAIGELWSTQAQRDREAELLQIGTEFRRAIISYYVSSPGGKPAYPVRLEDLLEDHRGPLLRRHLRKVYLDPITGSSDWGLVTTPDGRIRGVFSKSQRPPLKTANFNSSDRAFEKAATYSDWRFEHVVRNVPAGTPRR